MNSKEKVDSITNDEAYPVDIDREDRDFEVISYTLVAKDHHSDLENLHEKNIKQDYSKANREYIRYKADRTKQYTYSFCPLYFTTVFTEDNNDLESIFYVGSTNQKKNRFCDGHRAIQRLLDPQFLKCQKHIYFFQVWVKYRHRGIVREVPLEWFTNKLMVNDIRYFLEYLFIYEWHPPVNKLGTQRRRIRTSYRDWEDYWPSARGEKGINILSEVDFNSCFLHDMNEDFWGGVVHSINKEEYIEFLKTTRIEFI